MPPCPCPLRIEILKRVCVTGIRVPGDQVLLGAIPMQDMDLVLEPARQRVLPRRRLEENPQHAKLIKTVYGAGYLFSAVVSWG